MIDRKDWPEDARNAQAAFDEASWDAVEGYRDTRSSRRPDSSLRQMSGSVLPPTAVRRLRTTSPGYIRRELL